MILLLSAGILCVVVGLLMMQRAMVEAELPWSERDEPFGFAMWMGGSAVLIVGLVITISGVFLT